MTNKLVEKNAFRADEFTCWHMLCEMTCDSIHLNHLKFMKITRIDRNGKRREALLKEYFITASLVALLKQVGQEASKFAPKQLPEAAPIRVGKQSR
ncbi:MAG: hypothetical protein EAZ42_03380 [Verrucomicrobia bacterium]|nr:MAG: hypothetical protein EAZ42_03380 [Verrucomicrobiota bacterium]